MLFFNVEKPRRYSLGMRCLCVMDWCPTLLIRVTTRGSTLVMQHGTSCVVWWSTVSRRPKVAPSSKLQCGVYSLQTGAHRGSPLSSTLCRRSSPHTPQGYPSASTTQDQPSTPVCVTKASIFALLATPKQASSTGVTASTAGRGWTLWDIRISTVTEASPPPPGMALLWKLLVRRCASSLTSPASIRTACTPMIVLLASGLRTGQLR